MAVILVVSCNELQPTQVQGLQHEGKQFREMPQLALEQQSEINGSDLVFHFRSIK